jgi:predicted ATPase
MDKITRFTITKLHGYKNVDLHFTDNTLILVGENGAGKTTVLNLFYYLLSGQWSSMVKYSFEEITITIGNKPYKLRSADIYKQIRLLGPALNRLLPQRIRQRIVSLTEQTPGSLVITPELEMFCHEQGIPLNLMLRDMELAYRDPSNKNTQPLRQALDSITKSLDAQVLFLPTYRRIEQELDLILKRLDDRELSHRRDLLTSRRDNRTYVELVEFGMKDVDSAINSTLSQLNTFARESLDNLTFGYLRDIVEEQYTQVDLNAIKGASDETIDNVLNRIQEHILSSPNKQHLRHIIGGVKAGAAQNEHAMVICHYFTKLMEFQKELEKKESQMTSFCRVCNEYLVDKKFLYDLSKFTFTIRPADETKSDREVKLSQLSSGEKQIVSLFSHLYLSGENKYFVLIDEPELSLSVPWQRKFLVDIRSASFCVGLVAVTHSPFIYDNDLKRYAHGLGEFMV